RVIYADLCLGRVFSAQREMLWLLPGRNEPVMERDIRLCAYVAENAKPVDLLIQILAEMRREKPDDAGLARAAAALAPPEQALEDPVLLEQITADLDHPDAASLIAISQAYRVLGQTDKSVDAAEAAVNREPQNLEAMIELARAHAARASVIAAHSASKAPARA